MQAACTGTPRERRRTVQGPGQLHMRIRVEAPPSMDKAPTMRRGPAAREGASRMPPTSVTWGRTNAATFSLKRTRAPLSRTHGPATGDIGCGRRCRVTGVACAPTGALPGRGPREPPPPRPRPASAALASSGAAPSSSDGNVKARWFGWSVRGPRGGRGAAGVSRSRRQILRPMPGWEAPALPPWTHSPQCGRRGAVLAGAGTRSGA